MANGNETPQVSINQLANYLVASPAQRRRIIRDAKYPAAFRVNWYDLARRPICAFIAGGLTDEGPLTTEATRLYSLTGATAYEDARNRTNAEALEAFPECCEEIDLAGMTVQAGPNDCPKLVIHGISISVRPEFLLCGQHRGQGCAGALKLYFSKDDRLTEDTALYITCVLMRYVQNHCQPTNHITRHANCQVVDVFGKQVYSAPRSTTRRFQDIDAACQELALLWPTVEPPPGHGTPNQASQQTAGV